jgi:hypothetical protein
MVAVAATAAKLELVFHDAIETFYRTKRGASQVIRIEKVEVQSGQLSDSSIINNDASMEH